MMGRSANNTNRRAIVRAAFGAAVITIGFLFFMSQNEPQPPREPDTSRDVPENSRTTPDETGSQRGQT